LSESINFLTKRLPNRYRVQLGGTLPFDAFVRLSELTGQGGRDDRTQTGKQGRKAARVLARIF
jgi:hypothetical protein